MSDPIHIATASRRAVLTFAVVLNGCAATGESSESAAVIHDSAGVAIVDNDLAQLSAVCTLDSTPTITIGTDSGAAEYELYRVFGARRLSDGRIVLVNQGSQEIRFYDRQGTFLSRAGRAGQGPGEFRDAFHLWALPGDTIWVGDYRPWEFDVFAPDGTWIRAVKPSPQYVNVPDVLELLDDGRAVLGDEPFSPLTERFEPREVTVVVHGPDGSLLDTVGSYPNGHWGTIGADGSLGLFRLFESFTRIDAAGSTVVISHSSEPELLVYRADDTMRLHRIIRWGAEDRAITGAHVAAERARILAQYADMEPAMKARLVDPLVSEQRPVADEFPAFSTVIVGRDGRIWIREYPKPGEPDARRMIAFGADGRALCRATFPPFDEILEIGADYLLAQTEGEAGAERVQQFALRGPAEP
jgi:hypothetical protein